MADGAREACDELKTALSSAGITLPSLAVDLLSLATPYGRPLVELGRCNVEPAHALAEAIARGAQAGE